MTEHSSSPAESDCTRGVSSADVVEGGVVTGLSVANRPCSSILNIARYAVKTASNPRDHSRTGKL